MKTNFTTKNYNLNLLQKNNSILNAQKKIKEKNVSFLVFSYATQAKIMNPLGPTLGQFNVNLSEFCLKFNKATEKLAPGLFLTAKITKKLKAKEFNFIVNPPSIKILLEILLTNLYQTDEIELIEKNSFPIELIYDLILLYSFFYQNLSLKKSAFFVFSYLNTYKKKTSILIIILLIILIIFNLYLQFNLLSSFKNGKLTKLQYYFFAIFSIFFFFLTPIFIYFNFEKILQNLNFKVLAEGEDSDKLIAHYNFQIKTLEDANDKFQIIQLNKIKKCVKTPYFNIFLLRDACYFDSEICGAIDNFQHKIEQEEENKQQYQEEKKKNFFSSFFSSFFSKISSFFSWSFFSKNNNNNFVIDPEVANLEETLYKNVNNNYLTVSGPIFKRDFSLIYGKIQEKLIQRFPETENEFLHINTILQEEHLFFGDNSVVFEDKFKKLQKKISNNSIKNDQKLFEFLTKAIHLNNSKLVYNFVTNKSKELKEKVLNLNSEEFRFFLIQSVLRNSTFNNLLLDYPHELNLSLFYDFFFNVEPTPENLIYVKYLDVYFRARDLNQNDLLSGLKMKNFTYIAKILSLIHGKNANEIDIFLKDKDTFKKCKDMITRFYKQNKQSLDKRLAEVEKLGGLEKYSAIMMQEEIEKQKQEQIEKEKRKAIENGKEEVIENGKEEVIENGKEEVIEKEEIKTK